MRLDRLAGLTSAARFTPRGRAPTDANCAFAPPAPRRILRPLARARQLIGRTGIRFCIGQAIAVILRGRLARIGEIRKFRPQFLRGRFGAHQGVLALMKQNRLKTRVFDGEYASGQQRGVFRRIDAHGRQRSASADGCLNDRIQRILPAQRCAIDRDADYGQGRIGGDEAWQR